MLGEGRLGLAASYNSQWGYNRQPFLSLLFFPSTHGCSPPLIPSVPLSSGHFLPLSPASRNPSLAPPLPSSSPVFRVSRIYLILFPPSHVPLHVLHPPTCRAPWPQTRWTRRSASGRPSSTAGAPTWCTGRTSLTITASRIAAQTCDPGGTPTFCRPIRPRLVPKLYILFI